MRVSLILAAIALSLLLTVCATIDTNWLWSGVRTKDQNDIRTAFRVMTTANITRWYTPDPSRPNLIYFSASDGEVYSAEKIRGRWHISKAVLVY